MNIDILTNEKAQQLRQIIDQANGIVVCCHQNPDGDAIGSSLGLYEYLRDIGKNPLVIVPDAFPDFLHWMPGTERIIRYDRKKNLADEYISNADLIFCLDFNTLHRTGDMVQALTDAKADKVLIDHHLDPSINAVIEISQTEASSTSELVFRLINQLGGFERMTKKGAVPLYCGMMTDTGGFTYNSTRPEIFHIISLMLTKGINKDKIYRNVYNNYSVWRLRLVGYVLLERMTIMKDGTASYFVITKEDLKAFRYNKGDAEGLVNMPLQIKGMRLSISLREDTEKENLIWISLRSVDDFPCNLMAERYFNGGGHLNAAGGRLYCSIGEAEEYVRKAITEFEW